MTHNCIKSTNSLAFKVCSQNLFRSLTRSFCSAAPSSDEINIQDWDGRPKADPVAAAFFRPAVQMCLSKLTGLNREKVFRVARRGQEIKAPTYVFMTDKELKDARKAADQRAKQIWLQMPPVMSPRNQVPRVLEVDPGIKGFDSAKYVFTDITYGANDRSRFIVVREIDGTLREANGDERDRLNQTFFPREGRKVNPPVLFTDEQVLEEVLKIGGDRYTYVLDRNCVQFEPDHPKFIEIANTVYKAVDEKRDYSILHSTRHYGPMIFNLVLNRTCDNFIAHCLKEQNIDDVFLVVELYSLLHPDSNVARLSSDSSSSSSSDEEGSSFEENIKTLRTYIKEDSTQEIKLTIALESFLERKKLSEEQLLSLKKAHTD